MDKTGTLAGSLDFDSDSSNNAEDSMNDLLMESSGDEEQVKVTLGKKKFAPNLNVKRNKSRKHVCFLTSMQY